MSDQHALGVQAWPADSVERRAVASLIPYARNARTHSAQQVAQIAASITQWGWTVPVLIDEDGAIIAGHGRVLAARRLGLTEVPVMVASGWSAERKRAYLLADNQLALNAGWDEELLRLELGELADAEFDLSVVGFSDAELDRLQLFGSESLSDPDDVPEAPVEPVTQPGDLWLLGPHRLLCGDSTDASNVARVLAGVVPHLMVTDPPYGVEYDPAWRARSGTNSNPHKQGRVLNDHRADWREAWALFPGDVAYVWHGALHGTTVARSLEAEGFAIRSQIIWAKDRMVLSRGDYHWHHEPSWYAVREKATGHWTGDRTQTTLWQIPARVVQGDGQSTQKPVECMRRPILNNSSPGQAVYEPFCGSGTTVIAAEMEGRVCLSLELSPGYCDVIVQRWQAFTGQEAVLEGTDLTITAAVTERGVSLTPSASRRDAEAAE